MLFLIALVVLNIQVIDSVNSAIPENITVTFISPTSVKISWQTSLTNQAAEKYDITYKPANARVVAVAAGHLQSVVLGNLLPDTQYQLSVAAIYNGRRHKSRQIIFRTMELPPGTPAQQDNSLVPMNSGPPMQPKLEPGDSLYKSVYREEYADTAANHTSRELPTIRGVEIGIVLLVLVVWIGAIALFFNRWGKIRMLLPYQPDYKQEQLKVPGTGVCTGQCNGQHSHQHDNNTFHPWPEESVQAIETRCSRARINSAIFVSSEGKGFDSIEFIRRFGSQSVLCRKAKSAENLNDSEQGSIKRRMSSKDWSNDEITSPPIELQDRRIEIPLTVIQTQPTSSSAPSMPPAVNALNSSSSNNNISSSNNSNSKKPNIIGYLPALSISKASPPLEHEEELML